MAAASSKSVRSRVNSKIDVTLRFITFSHAERGKLLVGRPPADAGIVHQNMQLVGAAAHFRDQRRMALRSRQIAGKPFSRTGRAHAIQFRCNRLACIALARTDENTRTGLNKRLGHHAADAGRAASDQCSLTGNGEKAFEIVAHRVTRGLEADSCDAA